MVDADDGGVRVAGERVMTTTQIVGAVLVVWAVIAFCCVRLSGAAKWLSE